MRCNRYLAAGLALGLGLQAWAGDVVLLAKNGTNRLAIYVSPELMQADIKLPKSADYLQSKHEQDRQRLRDSVHDLAESLFRMSGAQPELRTGATADDGLLACFIGDRAEAVFGPLQALPAGDQTARLIVANDKLGCLGATQESTSFAVYEILDRLGCRWFMPGPLGEVIPTNPSPALAVSDTVLAPRLLARNIWAKDQAFKRRNRLGGPVINAAHCLENRLSREQRETYPETAGVTAAGERRPAWVAFNWASPKAAELIADGIITSLDKAYQPTVSLSPRDATSFSQSPEELALDADDLDPTFGSVSLTDRLLTLTNRICTRVTAKYPEVLFGLYAYVNYSRPPVRVRPHPNTVIGLAPITYNRVHPMTDPRHPTSELLQNLAEGWGRQHDRIFFRGYIYNLAEVSAPCPMIKKWSADFPIYLRNNVRYWLPETMGTFEANLPGLWLNVRLSWHSDADPAEVFEQFCQQFYGAAGSAMQAYWEAVDAAWTQTPEWAGSGHGYSQFFPPETMAQFRQLMDNALAACATAMQYRRVNLANNSLELFELFMTMKEQFALGQFAGLNRQVDTWHAMASTFERQYRQSEAFQRYAKSYFARFFEKPYRAAADLHKHYTWLSPALVQWRYLAASAPDDAAAAAQVLPQLAADAPSTDIARQTWSSIGLYHHMGSVWYATTLRLRQLPADKAAFLWLSKIDGQAKVYVNGQEVFPVSPDGKPLAAAAGYCASFSFDISAAAHAGENQIMIKATRTALNELGVGGLLGPVRAYREK